MAHARNLGLLLLLVNGKDVSSRRLTLGESIYPDDDLVAPLNPTRELIRRRVDLILEVVRFDRRDRTTHLVDRLDVLSGAPLNLVGQRFDKV